jgi:hypothetical protein
MSRPGRFTLEERAPGTHWIGGWVRPSAGLNSVEKIKIFPLPEVESRPSGPSLYRLNYFDSLYFAQVSDKFADHSGRAV